MEIINRCPLCGMETKTHPAEATTICELCGMSMGSESPKYIIVGKSSHHTLCCPKCVEMFKASSGLSSLGGRDK